MTTERAKALIVLIFSAVLVAVALVVVPKRAGQPESSQTVNTKMAAKTQAFDSAAGTRLEPAPITVAEMPKSASDVSVPQSRYKESLPELAGVPNLNAVLSHYKITLTENHRAFLEKNKFVLLPVATTVFSGKDKLNFDEMLTANDSISGSSYDFQRESHNTRLVTPDIVLHAYHRFFENSLEDLERGYLYNQLKEFLEGYVGNLRAARLTTINSNDVLAKRYDRLLAQALVAKIALENNGREKNIESIDSEADKNADTVNSAYELLHKYVNDLSPATYAEAKEELRRIYESDQAYDSQLFAEYNSGIKGDYTQYTPRSHYTKNSVLRSYFRSMMYLGRSTYFFAEDVGLTDSLLAVIAFNTKAENGILPRDNWQRIMEITGFYAGASDDITYNEWSEYVTRVTGKTTFSPVDAVNPEIVAKLGKSMNTLRMPKILSEIIIVPNIEELTKSDLLRKTLGFRLFGQRFTFDAWVLNSLTAGMENPEKPLPSMPSATFIPAAFGSERAKEFSLRHLTETLDWDVPKTAYFQSQVTARTNDLKKVKLSEWFSSLGTAWLYVLEPLTRTFGAGYPTYMQSAAFTDKSLITWLASYTELKHDTVLYAKQSYAELGAGAPDEGKKPPVVKGFVEPNIAFWKKLNALVDYNISLFNKYKLGEISSAGGILLEFKDDVAFYKSIAEKELTGVAITEEEYEKLRNSKLYYMASPIGGTETDPTEDSTRVALVTDVHTDAKSARILYQATGEPYIMLALVGNESSPRAVVGLVFSHYEFNKPHGKRLTDEEWKEVVYKKPGELPPRNFWYDELLAP